MINLRAATRASAAAGNQMATSPRALHTVAWDCVLRDMRRRRSREQILRGSFFIIECVLFPGSITRGILFR
jgi:hypothetical protein